jgi:Family of unknown function (DUF5681)
VRGGRRSTSFKKGQSGNPGGKPKRFAELPPEAKAEAIQAIHDVKAAAKAETADAIKTLKTVMNNESAPSAARVGAAIAILDRGWGKPMQPVEASVSIFDQMTDDEQKTLLAALAAIKAAEEEEPGLPH